MFKLIYFGTVFVLGLGMALVCMAGFLNGRRPLKAENGGSERCFKQERSLKWKMYILQVITEYRT